MTSILKSDNTKNGILLKENTKKFEEATSTSGCDLEMSEITSSMPASILLGNNDVCSTIIANIQSAAVSDRIDEKEVCVKIKDEVSVEIEDVIDGFSIFSFLTEEDIIKFSIKNEKLEVISESENSKFKKMVKSKRQSKNNKASKEVSYNEDGIDIYDFQGNSESSPSSKNSSVNFRKTISKKLSTKFTKKFKLKFKAENTLSPSEENSSSTSVTESHNNLVIGDCRNESPRPTSNDDNNVVSTTTPDNVNIELDKLELANCLDKTQSENLISPLKKASLRLYKLEDELPISSHNVAESNDVENPSDLRNDQDLLTFYSGAEKIHCNQNSIISNHENYQPKIVPTKFSVDLLTKITDKQSNIEDKNKCLYNQTNFDWNIIRKSNSQEYRSNSQASSSSSGKKQIAFDTVVDTGESHNNNSMTTTAVKHMVGNNRCSSASFRDGSMSSNGSCNDGRGIMCNDNQLTNDDESNNDKTTGKSTVNSPMQSWLELHNKGLIHQQNNALSNSIIQSNSNATIMPPKSTNGSSFNPLCNPSHNSHSVNNGSKSLHESTLLDWKNSYYESSKLLANSVPKLNQNYNSLTHDLVNNIRFQQEQQDLMNALRLKHENSKIPKPLVHMGLDAMYKVDHPMYKNPESRFQTPNVRNYFMPNSQLPTEFNTANVFKTRSDPRCHQSSLDVTSNKDAFNKNLPAMSSSYFKTPENLKKRGQWCDMHVKIAYFIYRSQRRMSMLKSQELNSKLSHLMYSQKVPQTGSAPIASPYPSNFVQHSNPYMDYRSSQMKQDPGYLNYQPKSSNAFLNAPIRPINPYHNLMSQNIEADFLPPSNSYDDHHQTPEQKWLRLLSQYMASHPLSSVEKPNPEILSQLYMWYQQLSQGNSAIPPFNSQAPSAPSMQPSNLDPNNVYFRKYMEHLSSSLGSMKPDSGSYASNPITEREMQIYLMKHQQYQKALMSKYQSAAINKPSNMGHVNPLLINSFNPLYNKKMMENKLVNSNESMLPQYSDCVQSLVNPKYRLSQDQIRQLKQESLGSHHSRNGFSKLPDPSNSKRRKLTSESMKTDLAQNGVDKDDMKLVTDLTSEYGNGTTNNNVSLEKNSSLKSRENLSCHLQTAIPDTKE